jgi:hypothetical protein
VTNTPKYWQKVKFDMIAKLENIGPFHLFFTLSCGDSRYGENFSTFLVQNGYKLEYIYRHDCTTETRVISKDGRQINKDLATFLNQDVSESLHKMIRTNVITATRNFHHRVESFKKEILMGKNNPMKIKYISYRVEFQGRGAAHIHGTLWLNIKEIENSMTFQSEETPSGTLSEAFRKFRDDVKLTEAEKKAVAKFTDMFVTCSLNPNTVHDDPQIGERIINIIKQVNCHRCTNPCEKYGDKCKYGFPRYPLKETIVIDKKEFLDNPENEGSNLEDSTKKYRQHIVF